MKDPYLGTTASQLDYYYGNIVPTVRLWHKYERNDEDFEAKRVEFVEGLERAIADNLPEFYDLTHQHLRDMIELAQSGPWSDPNTINKIRLFYNQIVYNTYKKLIQ